MASNKTFAELAAETLSFAENYAEQTMQLTEAQRELIETYEKTREAMKEKKAKLDLACEQAIKDIKAAFGEKHNALKEQEKALKEAFEDECVNLGLRAEDIPLTEYQVVKKADKVAKGFLSGIGKVKRYVKEGLDS